MKNKDLFISHASEDKDDFVRPLANLLNEYGLKVWYDEFELKIGTSLSRSIDKGISNSNYGLIVLSKSFFSKNWTEYELKSLNSYEIENGDILLPVWKDVTVKEVREFSPYLADKFALTTKNTIEDIALKIIENCNPKLFSEIHYKIRINELLKTAKVEKKIASELKAAPIRHLKLNENLISRIRLIRSSLLLCYPHSMAFWLDGFQRDLNIENEVRYWEHISSCFLEIIVDPEMFKLYKRERENFYKDVFQLLFLINNSDSSQNNFLENFDSEFIEKASDIFSHNIPIYDFDEELPFKENY
ncbi:toll/interleukin-1 receptor domain-containing protein [Flavobacterium sp. TR2]|uniref:toll/interleukin-1 receptor domain-containing protein n=1 Tax=Flavobacterium sp. TR2 TaxID=2977321 RepID=UPI0021B09882|nr:toll/interleukin-1 receptor domain-containing protein [Flavobacterium sp. TR2]UWY26990.1 toll/interleukin-1 receptor domain-containing protein [Flavobacterium sp. TR2]